MRRGDLSSPRSTVTLGDSRQLQTGAVGALSKYGGAVSVAEAPGVALIRTKVHGPIARPLVPRPALVDRLVHGPARRLTLVRGQAGWGKSSLLAAWSASDPREFAWLALDRGDNDPVRFFMYAIEALQSLAGSVGKRSASILRTPGVDIVDHVLPILINELDALPESCVFVLEDYHAIDNAEVHEAVSYLLDHAPASLELVLSTRVEPPLPVSRLRGRGDLLEIASADLQFSTADALTLLVAHQGLDIEPSDVNRLVERTEGWPAGLYLAALSLRGRDDAHEFIDAFAGDDRNVVDYLTTEVLAGQARGDPCLHADDVGSGPALCSAVRPGGRWCGLGGDVEGHREVELVPDRPRQPPRVVSLSPSVPRAAAERAGQHRSGVRGDRPPARGDLAA